jgi:hypothetical protein
MDNQTVLTIFHHDSGFIVQPILDRLANPKTMLRTLSDSSFLVNSLIDSIVGVYLLSLLNFSTVCNDARGYMLADHYIPITEEYMTQFEALEVLLFDKPTIDLIKCTSC